MSVLDLDEPPHGDTLEVLLGLFEDEVRAGDGPALGDAGEGDGTTCTEAHVVGGADGKVGEEKEIADGVRAELEVTDGNTVGRSATEGAEVDGLDVDRCSEGVEGFLCLWVEGIFVGGESEASGSEGIGQQSIA